VLEAEFWYFHSYFTLSNRTARACRTHLLSVIDRFAQLLEARARFPNVPGMIQFLSSHTRCVIALPKGAILAVRRKGKSHKVLLGEFGRLRLPRQCELRHPTARHANLLLNSFSS
jgi:hypothetical protein